MRPETKVALVGSPTIRAWRASSAPHMKLFFQSDDPGQYAEIFVNVVAPERRLELHEKDPEYRAPLLRSLAFEGAG
jgi:hypothetical protein